MKHKIVIVGAGTIGGIHADAYAKMENAELAAIVDPRREAGETLASRHGARWYRDVEAALEAEGPEVVDICVPTYLHAEIVHSLTGKGTHIVCEKPIARSLEEAREMIETCRRDGVRLFVAHVVRFFPEYRTAHDLIQANEIGKPATAFAMRGGRFPSGWEDWYADSERSGTLVLDLMIHDFDFLRWCLGDVERVYAKSLLRSGLEHIDHAFVSLRFAGGAIGNVEGTWAYPAAFRTAFEFSGTGGILHHTSEAESPITTYVRTPEGGDRELAGNPLRKSPYQIELEHFLRCIERDEEAVVTPLDAYKALEISLAALRSISSGAPVVLQGETAKADRPAEGGTL